MGGFRLDEAPAVIKLQRQSRVQTGHSCRRNGDCGRAKLLHGQRESGNSMEETGELGMHCILLTALCCVGHMMSTLHTLCHNFKI